MQINPRTRLKIYQVGEKINNALTILNLGCIGIYLMTEVPVPTEALLTVVLNVACGFLCAMGADMVKKVHGLDDKGNFSWNNKTGGSNDQK
jgi:3-phosphoglycerate kinase